MGDYLSCKSLFHYITLQVLLLTSTVYVSRAIGITFSSSCWAELVADRLTYKADLKLLGILEMSTIWKYFITESCHCFICLNGKAILIHMYIVNDSVFHWCRFSVNLVVLSACIVAASYLGPLMCFVCHLNSFLSSNWLVGKSQSYKLTSSCWIHMWVSGPSSTSVGWTDSPPVSKNHRSSLDERRSAWKSQEMKSSCILLTFFRPISISLMHNNLSCTESAMPETYWPVWIVCL